MQLKGKEFSISPALKVFSQETTAVSSRFQILHMYMHTFFNEKSEIQGGGENSELPRVTG